MDSDREVIIHQRLSLPYDIVMGKGVRNKLRKVIKYMDELQHLIGKDYEEMKSKPFADMVIGLLKKDGRYIKREVRVSDRGDGLSGRIDVVYEDIYGVTAIEIDRKSPRKKSIMKLQNLAADHRFIILRSPVSIIKI